MGSMHGLVIAALADLVTSWAIAANGDDYLDHSSVSLEVNFLKWVGFEFPWIPFWGRWKPILGQ